MNEYEKQACRNVLAAFPVERPIKPVQGPRGPASSVQPTARNPEGGSLNQVARAGMGSEKAGAAPMGSLGSGEEPETDKTQVILDTLFPGVMGIVRGSEHPEKPLNNAIRGGLGASLGGSVGGIGGMVVGALPGVAMETVSYTHLTLPTILLV